LILDIETVPDLDRWQRPEPVEGAEPRAGFPPTWAHRIIVIGCLWLDHGYRLKRLGVVDEAATGEGSPDHRERALLEDFSRFVGRARPLLVTYNGRAFDLPVIALRCLRHGVPMRFFFQDRDYRYRFSDSGHIDLYDFLSEHGAARVGSLDAIARVMGLPGKVGVDGSQVEGLYNAGQLQAIKHYCLSDVAQTAFLFLRYRLLQGALDVGGYQRAAQQLFDALAADGRVDAMLQRIERSRLLLEPAAPPSNPPIA
jgi:predicted PolB exonuclease-like 3'-5' exonuclease